jgi:hypothetical protein
MRKAADIPWDKLLAAGGAGLLASKLVEPTIANTILIKRIREHPAARAEAAKRGILSAGIGAGTGAALAAKYHEPAGELLRKSPLPKEFYSLYAKTSPRARIAGTAAMAGSLASEVVLSRLINRLAEKSPARLAWDDLRYKQAMKVTPGVNMPWRELLTSLRTAPKAPVSVDKATGMAQSIYDWLTHKQLSNLNAFKNEAVLTSASDLARKLPGTPPGNIPGIFHFFKKHHPEIGTRVSRELLDMYAKAPIEEGIKAQKVYPSALETEKLLPPPRKKLKKVAQCLLNKFATIMTSSSWTSSSESAGRRINRLAAASAAASS